MVSRRFFNRALLLGPLAKWGAGRSENLFAGLPALGEENSAGELVRQGNDSVSPQKAQIISGHWVPMGQAWGQRFAQGPALLLVAHSDWEHGYIARAHTRLLQPKPGSEAGLALQIRGDQNFVIFVLAQKKNGPYAILRINATPGAKMVGDEEPLTIDFRQLHELKIEVYGPHFCGYIDGEPVVNYSFLGMSPPSHAADGTLWPEDPSHGHIGLFTLNAGADFKEIRTYRLGPSPSIVTPQLPKYDEEGHLLPRQSYAQTMERFTQWMMRADEVVDKSQAPAPIRSLPVYVFANWVNSGDEIDLFGRAGESLQTIQEFAFNHSLLISGAVRYYVFSGDKRALEIGKAVADWHLKNVTPPGDTLPYLSPSTVNWQSDGSWKPQAWGLEPDKSAFMGLALLKLSAATGDEKYYLSAKRMALTLRRLQQSDGGWPFRVDPKTGAIKTQYTENALWYIQFFNQMAELTSNPEYKSISERSFRWLLSNPVETNDWRRLYGDVPAGMKSYDQWIPLETVMYLLDHHLSHPDFMAKARRIFEWVNRNLVVNPGFFPGIPGIIEQTAYRAVLTHHTLRLAQTYAKLWEVSGEGQYRELAQQIANSVTWCLMSDGKMRLGFWRQAMSIPLVLVYNDQFCEIMAAMPQTAPKGENHLLRSSGNVGEIEYEESQVSYSTRTASSDLLVVRGRPRSVMVSGGAIPELSAAAEKREGWTYDPSTSVLRISHPQGSVLIRL